MTMYPFQNSRYSAFGDVDCDIDHPKYGWIPYTVHEHDNKELYDAVIAAGNIAAYVPPAPPASPTSEELDAEAAAVASVMFEDDKKTKALGYVLADLLAATFSLSEADARAQVQSRFQDYYRTLL